ncbi:Endonuclease 8 1 [Rubripirellula obstinata]|uniref:DNA-(apurinic or apyrimidinic site) lyase n=1 Tax=Rubripirellula obstinata TaxID=406547 RepID=A0A5B1CPI0_9BACT|nr:DNA glycosylase [Rubripirellula obstinata]KAA1261855.1 Endonuclease 8 1 [Rubripirellula obstinata]
MPEGHKTHFIAREHSEKFAGQKLKVTSPQGRFTTDARKVNGKVLERVEAVGKHLFYVFESGHMINVHLGRYGKYRELPSPPPAPVGQVRMRIRGDGQTVDLTGPTTCRVIDCDGRSQIESKLGPDPLASSGTNAAKKKQVWASFSKSNKPIGALLLDQSIVAGVGNIFRAEVLFETELNPEIAGNQLSKESFDALWSSLTKMMKVGLKYGKIVSVTAKEAGMPVAKIEGKDRFRVYGKQRCPRCNAKIETIEVAARKLYVCPSCQRLND